MESYQGTLQFEADHNPDRLAHSITTNVNKISQNVSYMTKMVNQLETNNNPETVRKQLRNIQTYTQKLVKDTSSLLMEYMKKPLSDPTEKLSRERLRDEYMATLNAFQTAQKAAAEKSKEEVKKAKAKNFNIGDPFATHSTNELIDMEDRKTRIQMFKNEQTEEELRELELKENDVRKLESDIMDVNDIFKKLGTMIHDQGSTVISIESSVENAAHNVANANQQLRQAAVYRNNMRKKKLYLFIAITIILLVIFIIIFHN